MKAINAKTKLMGVMGSPIGHSRSPELHNFLAEQVGLNYRYLAFEPKREDLKRILEGAKAMGIAGFNITSPFKVDVFSLMDELSVEAEKMGNVNTVVNQDGQWVGYNTDGEGFYQSLLRNGFDVSGKHVLLLGTGGTARTLSYKLAQKGAASITISSRRENVLKDVTPALSDYPQTALFEGFDREKEYDLIVNCTPMGMAPNEHVNPMPQGVTYREDMLCCDLIYNPAKTLFLQEAEKQGARILNGRDMFIYQGILAFELFTNTKLSKSICDSVFEKWSIISGGTEEN
ncbi:MAG: shikimate dehydrogenase [Ruminococcaceae bacterium]|nr:shikimate dehydrogenase [Oscillospiraceae bacterium]